MDITNINTVLWDWNGTLLNDLAMCTNTINDLLVKRNLKQLTINDYKNIFTFPVKDYYLKAGFDFTMESFEDVGLEFMELYFERVKNTGIFPEVPGILKRFNNAGFRQFVISAMEHNYLVKTVTEKGLAGYFKGVSGINDHYAGSKQEMAREFLENQNLDPSTTCFIGDTLHDFEVAENLGVYCILVSAGHQSFERLLVSGTMVLKSITEVINYFRINHSQII